MKNLKSFVPHIIAVIVFLTITATYFSPLFNGKEIKQPDILNYKGMVKEIDDTRKVHNIDPIWTNSMFGGMPAYQIAVLYPSNLMAKVNKVISMGIPDPANYVFLCMLCFYILMLVLKVDPWLGLVGAFAFGFSSYFFIIIEAGHNSKAHAIGFMPAVLAGVILTFRGKYFAGGALAALFLALELYANHLQITYYLMLLLLIYGVCEIVKLIKDKDYIHFLKASGVLIIAIVLAVGSNITSLWSTYEYGKHTTRGKTELTVNPDGTSNNSNITSGLDKDYATQWSYGVGETMTLVIPNFKGGGSGMIANNHKEALKKADSQLRQYIGQSDQYWGDQPFTSGPVYVGAGVIFLFLLGLIYVNKSLKWVLLAGTILSITLAWGRNYMPLTEFFLEHFPGYNKFRAVSMILVIAELTLPILAILGVKSIVDNRETMNASVKIPMLSKPVLKKNLIWIAFAFSGGLCLLYLLLPDSLTSFYKSDEYDDVFSQIAKNNNAETATAFLDNLKNVRAAIFKADVIRSLFIIILVFALIWSFIKFSYNKVILYLGLGVVLLGDLWSVDKRYLNEENFVKKTSAKVAFQATKANNFILQDNDPNYRVLNIAVSTFNDASTSYYHKSIGGYHGAKLKRYQELIEFQISGNMQKVMNTLRTSPNEISVKQTLSEQGVLNMLNTKYVIVNSDAAPILNPYALGNAWFVNDYELVPNADAEILGLSDLNPASKAVIDERFKAQLENLNLVVDSSASIVLESYLPNNLVYRTNTQSEQLAVFSEIYYADGWNAYVDGNLMPHARANYVLRTMRVPAGEHKIEFKFEPKIYHKGERISLASSSLLILVLIGVGIFELKKALKAE